MGSLPQGRLLFSFPFSFPFSFSSPIFDPKPPMAIRHLPFFPFLLFFGLKIFAQTAPDTLHLADLQSVTVTAYRLEESDLTTPLSLTSVGSFRLQNGQQQLALDEALAAIPGVFVQNGTNFAQDVRVSVRGFGARSAFGIRGVKILVDGFPETTPDGQGQVDNLDPALVTSLSVVRGSTAGLYGNASGGQLSFTTLNFDRKNFVEAGASFGSFGFEKYQARTGGKAGKVAWSLGGVTTKLDGYRAHSAVKNYLLNGGLRIAFDSSMYLVASLNYVNSPKAKDAGALTLKEVEADRASARQSNVAFDAGETLWQGRAGLELVKNFSPKTKVTTRIFHTLRSFSNKLPTGAGGIVELERAFTGLNFNYLRKGKIFNLPWEANAGFELEHQNDDRRRFDNQLGARGSAAFSQIEEFSTAGFYLSQKISLTDRLQVYPGVRLDAMWLGVKDFFLENGDDSGDKNYRVVNPIFGASYRFSDQLNLFANAGTGFETPAFTEFANPTGAGGFNPGLDPQKSQNLEIGCKGVLAGGRLKYELAVFHIRLSDELVPFEDASQSRTFYRNAGRSQRSGVEVGLGSYLGGGFYCYANYAWSNFRFREYELDGENLDGNRLPGVPKHRGYAELRYFKSLGLQLTQTVQVVSPQYADDLNRTRTDGYVLANFRAGYRLRLEKWSAEPSVGINNLFDSRYFSNIRINGFGGRYYEPAPGIHFFVGMKVEVN